MRLNLLGLGHFHPKNELTNAFLESLDIGTNDQWIITPALTVATGSELTFWLSGLISGYADLVEIRITENSVDPADFLLVESIVIPTEMLPWAMYTVDLSLYAGQTINIGWREYVENNWVEGNFIGLDLVTIM